MWLIGLRMTDNNINSCHGGSVCCCQGKLQRALHKFFKFSSFRPGQMEAARAILHGHDTFVRMARGSGKSLCMFLAPLSKSETAIGVIISPLNGLQQQVCCLYIDYERTVDTQSTAPCSPVVFIRNPLSGKHGK